MKKYLFLLFLIAYAFKLPAQHTDALVNAEKAFEKICLEKGIRDGFLSFVDSNAIILTDKGPVNAKQFWNSLPVLEAVFTWSPSFTEMSITSDWGYTSGNFEHRAKFLADTANATGQYSTVWHKTEQGEWKYLIDIGNDHAATPLVKYAKTIKIEKSSGGSGTNADSLMDIEKKFILLFEKNINEAYQQSGSEKYILNITGYTPITTTAEAISVLKKTPSPLKYHPAGSAISPAKDMAVVYGVFERDHIQGKYLRIWRHEKNGWKIALEVVKI